MSSSNVSAATSHFPQANEGFITTLGSTISAGDPTVPLTTTSGLTNGSLFVGIIEPGVEGKEQTFAGIVDTGGTQITGVIWTRGSDVDHNAGATIVDYVAGTHLNLISKGILEEHKQSGAHSDVHADTLEVTGDTTLADVTVDSITVAGTASAEGWSPLGDVPDSVTAKGNGSYELLFNGNDLTDTVSEGMRLRTTRTVPAPIQCATFDGTNDYFSKSSPAGMTFTDDFSVSAWVKLSSYGTLGVVSRINGTQGWQFFVNSAGQLQFQGYNASLANYRGFTTYQSLPLNKWVHVAVQLDMSAYTATTTTMYAMVDGVDVPISLIQAGTNPTALVQAGNLEVGSLNAANFMSGKIAQVAIYSAKVTQATHLAAMNQGLTGSETSLVSAYSLSNSLEDLSANNNDLTANGGVLATTADSPFGNSGVSTTLDYGIVMKKAFSTDTTLTVQVPEGCTIPTSGGVSSMDYSINAVPYGFPRDKGRWRLSTLLLTTYSKSVGSATTWYVSPIKLSVPIGAWLLGYSAQSKVGGTIGAASVNGNVALTKNSADYTTTTVPPDELRRTSWLYAYGTGATMIQTAGSLYNATEQLLSASTTYSLSGNTSEAAGGFIFEFYYGTEIFAENQYI